MADENNYLDDGDLQPREEPDPKAFEPSIAKPFPTFPCTQVKSDGERCKSMAITGMLPHNAKCVNHGGRIPSVKEAAANRVEAARMAFLDDLPMAQEAIRQLAMSGTSEAVKYKAAELIIHQTVGKGAIEINVNETVTVNAADEVMASLNKLFENRLTFEEDDEERDDIVDADVVEDEDVA